MGSVIFKSDKEIVREIIKKNEKVFMFFYKKHNKSIYNYVFKQLRDKQTAEEVVQDIFIDFIEALRDFQNQCGLKTFLYSIASRKTVDVIRKNKIKKILFSALPSYVVEGLKTVLIDDEIEKNEIKQGIKKVFVKLPNDYRLVLRLKYIDGERVKAIAKKLSIGFKAAESLIYRARKAFVKVYDEICPEH